MNISEATRVAQLNDGTNEQQRFQRHMDERQPISYHGAAKYKILGKKEGFSGQTNYYLKLVA